jgi:hypothetical protein
VIVISGALVVVAIVLLAIGLISGTLGFIYASIAGSVVAFIFLIVGVMQRRGEEVPATADAVPAPALASANDVEGVTAILPSGSRLPSRMAEPAGAEPVAAARRTTREAPAAADAAAKAPAKRAAAKAPASAAGAATKAAAKKAPAKTAAKKAPAKAATKATTKAAAKKAPAKTAAKKAPAKTAAKKAPAKTATKAAAKKAPAKTAAKKTPAKKAATRR